MPELNADRYNWRAPHFLFDVIRGGVPADELRRRTVSVTIIDNAREYDTIEWVVRNEDGLMTRTENLALGLLVRVRYGYNDFTTNWRTFVISRMRGGVGVHKSTKKTRPAVHEAGALLTLSGRNRNAPDVKSRRRKGAERVPKPGSTGRTFYRRSRGASTEGIARLDDVKKDGYNSPTDAERILRVTRVSDAVREIGRRMGYTDQQMRIETTDDIVNSVVIPMGMTYSEFLEKLAADKGWKVKAEGPVFVFHSERWKEGTEKVKFEFVYGGPDIIDLSIDADFRLPDPRKVTAKTYSPIARRVDVADADKNNTGVRSSAEFLFTDDRNRTQRNATTRDTNLRRTEIFYAAGGSQKLASSKAVRRFEQKTIRSMRIKLVLVGNPHVKARDEVKLSGTGCQLVDGNWYIHTARHVYDGTTYITEIDLRPPSRKKAKGKRQFYRTDVKDKKAGAKDFKSSDFLFTGNDRLLSQSAGR